ncbi:uncharacterized protein LDX57_009325 [Aspergillus melleus]|uniref:uncharacterized protein n=1 Tax=Aspergillus melleus TaxID=138277 RepID=UPI001E8D0F46|nr:uncharacterized protein LDX57_009325 [Aspergillus melleus]KAH8431670.1 hypothetical protein LDX57_009325 [Aspergillus melleus]
MSAEVTLLPPQSTDLSSLSNPTPTNSLPPFAALNSPSLSLLPYLTDESWLNINALLFQPPTANASSSPETQSPNQAGTQKQNPPPSPPTSQVRKRRNNYSIRHAAPPAPREAREQADREKRENFLARNRRAATRCRERKREFTKKLQEQYEDVARRKHALESEFAQLQGEVLGLKNELLRHSQCAHPAIQNHLAGMVKNLTVAKSPILARSGPAPWEASASASSSVPSIDEDAGSSTLPVASCETDRTRRDSVLSVSTDASMDSVIDEGLFEELLNYGGGPAL